MVSKDSVQTHGPRVKQTLMAQIAQRRMAVDYLDLLTDKDLPQEREGAENGWKGGRAVDDPMRKVIDF